MHSRTRLGLLTLLALLAGFWWCTRNSLSSNESVPFAGASSLFSKQQISTFLASAKAAEALSDPLQRCLTYPDPPGSHWSHVAVVAYCNHRNEVRMTFDQAKALIDSGHVADLDRRFADLANGKGGSGHPGDDVHRALADIFDNDSDRVRVLADAWKKQSPNSAYSYAGSGMAYVAQGAHARGQEFRDHTPPEKLEEMGRLFALAEADLAHAITLDPKCVAAYAELIILGRFDRSRGYALEAVRRGLAIEPDSYAIHSEWVWLARPEWGGTPLDMLEVVFHAVRYDDSNPLLFLVVSEAAAVAADLEHCDCGTHDGRLAFARVFDNVANSSTLLWPSRAAAAAGQNDMGLVYLSEAVRFSPAMTDAQMSLVDSLLAEGDNAEAMAEAQRMFALAPDYRPSHSRRGAAYYALHDYLHAEADFRTALTLPGDDDTAWILAMLGDIYVHKTHEWDKAWQVAEQLVKNYPDDPSGWLVRLCVQQDQPRPGAADTAHYLMAHFADDARARPAIAHFQATLAQAKR